jgi:uncharacterized membrane protein HdeD (DUF308 family)
MSVPPSQAKTSDQATTFSAFISYATKADKDAAMAIAGHLEALGLKCWIAPRNVRPGKQYAGEIVRGIATSRCFILVLSGAANGSKFVRREVEQADRKDKPVYTIRIEEVDPSEDLQLFLSEIHWIDAFEGKLATHMEQLAQMLREEEPNTPQRDSALDEKPVVDIEETPVPKAVEPPRKTQPATKQSAPSAPLGETLFSMRWIVALRGVLALAMGLGYEFSPPDYFVYQDFISLMGWYLVGDGVLAMAPAISRGGNKWRYLFLIEGLISLAFGVVILGSGVVTIFHTLLASWAIATGALRGLAASRLSYRDANPWFGISAAAALALGIILLAFPMPSERPDRWIAGWIAVGQLVIGAAFLVLGFELDRRKLANIPAERVAALKAASQALAPFWWAFAARGLVGLCGGALFAWLGTSGDLLTRAPLGLAWVLWLGVYMIALGVATLVPGIRASSDTKRWRVFIAESAILIAAGLVVFFSGPGELQLAASIYYLALAACGLLLLYAANGLDVAFGRPWLAASAITLLLFPPAYIAEEWVEGLAPFPGREDLFLLYAVATTAILAAAPLLAFALKLRARTRPGFAPASPAARAVRSVHSVAPSALAERRAVVMAMASLLIAGGLPFMLWSWFPNWPLWTMLPIPGAIVMPMTICMILSGVAALAWRPRGESDVICILGGTAGIAIGIALLTWMSISTDSSLTGFPPNDPFLFDPFDPVIAGWGAWLGLVGGLLLLRALRLKQGASRVWLALAGLSWLLLGGVFLSAAADVIEQEIPFFFYVGGLALMGGAFLVAFAMSLPKQERTSPVVV